MDVILAQLGRQELEAHCSVAMKTQLAALQRALEDAVAAAKRAEEVQLASQKLAITLFEDGSELSSSLLASTRLRDDLGQSLERLTGLALGAAICATPTKDATPSRPSTSSNTPQKTDSTPQKKRKAVSTEEETSTKKKSKHVPSVANPRALDTPAKSPEMVQKSSTALAKALAAAANLTEELAKKKKTVDRVEGLKPLVLHFNTAHKHLDPDSAADHDEALETLSVVVTMAVSIMQHGKPSMQRHWVHKFRDNVADIQEKFPDSASAFNGCMNSLSKIISSFPLTVKEGQNLRMRLRKALEKVKGWKEGNFSVSDVTQSISLVAEALDSTCPNWNPRTDKTVRELTALLLDKVGLLKDNKKQEKRKQKLQSWLDEMNQAKDGSQDVSTAPRSSPSATDKPVPSKSKAQKKKKKKIQVSTPMEVDEEVSSPQKAAAPRKGHQNPPQSATTTVVSPPSSSATSSDSECAQYVKGEAAE